MNIAFFLLTSYRAPYFIINTKHLLYFICVLILKLQSQVNILCFKRQRSIINSQVICSQRLRLHDISFYHAALIILRLFIDVLIKYASM